MLAMKNSCIEIDVRRVGEVISFGVSRIGEKMSAVVSRVGEPLSFNLHRIGDAISFGAERIGEPIKFRCGLVCSTGVADAMLRVEPESIWLMPENFNSADVVVYANVTWIIE